MDPALPVPGTPWMLSCNLQQSYETGSVTPTSQMERPRLQKLTNITGTRARTELQTQDHEASKHHCVLPAAGATLEEGGP